MIGCWSKLKERWKQEWWLKHAAEVAREFQSRQDDLEKRLNDEIKVNLTRLELERDTLYAKIKVEIEKGKILEEEVAYREKTLKDRKMELIQLDNDVKEQIKILEAKSSPSAVWAQAFTAGASKAWDLITPVMTENLSKLKIRMEEEAVQTAIARLRASNKK